MCRVFCFAYDVSGECSGMSAVIDADNLFGHVNDSIRGLATEGPPHEAWEFICECADLECHALVSMTLTEFDASRSSSPPYPVLSLHHVG